jgi:hypothetical protein
MELIEAGKITWAGLLEGAIGALIGVVILVFVARWVYRSERKERRADRLLTAMIELEKASREHLVAHGLWEDPQLGSDHSVTFHTMMQQLRMALASSRGVNRKLRRELFEATQNFGPGKDRLEWTARLTNLASAWIVDEKIAPKIDADLTLKTRISNAVRRLRK